MAKTKVFDGIEENATLAEPVEIRFSKDAILTFKEYAHRRDLLQALLRDDKEYTMAEVHAIIQYFMKGKVL